MCEKMTMKICALWGGGQQQWGMANLDTANRTRSALQSGLGKSATRILRGNDTRNKFD